jgi:hypothetical protein
MTLNEEANESCDQLAFLCRARHNIAHLCSTDSSIYRLRGVHPCLRLPIFAASSSPAFLRSNVTASPSAQGLLQIKVYEPESGRVDLLLNGVSPEHLVTIRDISNFIGELRTEMSAGAPRLRGLSPYKRR